MKPHEARDQTRTAPKRLYLYRAPQLLHLIGRLNRCELRRIRRLLEGEPLLGDYHPERCVRLPVHERPRAAHPAIDAHNHLGRWLTPGGDWMVPDVGGLLDLMDGCNIRALVNLDGRWGDELEHNLDRYDRTHPGRFATFCHVDWEQMARSRSAQPLVKSLERSQRAGARGLKVWKDLGLSVRDSDDRLILPDDPRLTELWEGAADLGLPVMIHTGDPVAFFQPSDPGNERLEELAANPTSHHIQPNQPRFERLVEALEATVDAHPKTAFIGAHVGGYSEDLCWVGRMLKTYGNFTVDLAGRVNELGRQPRAAAKLILEYPERVLWGSDSYPPCAGEYAVQFRFLETEDECFDYSSSRLQTRGRWTISGLGLPESVLSGVYAGNATRLISALNG